MLAPRPPTNREFVRILLRAAAAIVCAIFLWAWLVDDHVPSMGATSMICGFNHGVRVGCTY